MTESDPDEGQSRKDPGPGQRYRPRARSRPSDVEQANLLGIHRVEVVAQIVHPPPSSSAPDDVERGVRVSGLTQPDDGPQDLEPATCQVVDGNERRLLHGVIGRPSTQGIERGG